VALVNACYIIRFLLLTRFDLYSVGFMVALDLMLAVRRLGPLQDALLVRTN
jgi:hypothetical protein